MKPAAAALLVAGLAGLAACGGRPGAVATSAPEAPPSAIDGRYRGIARLIRADTAGCPRSGPRMITVEGSVLSTTYRGTPSRSFPLTATVTPDGQIHGSDGRGNVDGSISGNHMDLTVTSPICDLRFALTRIP